MAIPSSMWRRSDVLFRSHIGQDAADQVDMSSRRRNFYVREKRYPIGIQIGTQVRLTDLRRHRDI